MVSLLFHPRLYDHFPKYKEDWDSAFIKSHQYQVQRVYQYQGQRIFKGIAQQFAGRRYLCLYEQRFVTTMSHAY